ncbi:MAG: bifunctional non-ous end joining protein LigD [Streptomyces sp.]|jgi:bifunctional non-homologous end joining protein LigD|nr:bifunctional non-ous end joining protein LigD [Streptomyces sp.]
MPTSPERQAVEVDGRRVVLTHLDKVIFPASGHTKAQLLHYYAQVAAALVPHAAGRLASFVRAPEGPDGQIWFAKRPPNGTPEWVRTAEGQDNGDPQPHVVVDSTAALVAMANLGAFEVHVPQWKAGSGRDAHDRLVLDLDPGEGADLVVCCRVAERLRQMLEDDGLPAYPVTSGSKGLHLYAPLVPAPARAATGYAKALAARMRDEHPGLVVVSMTRSLRAGKVLIDWSQNASAKTTACPYTVRVRERPGVATPVTWDEVAACRSPKDLAFAPEDVMRRVEKHGDLAAGLDADTGRGTLP